MRLSSGITAVNLGSEITLVGDSELTLTGAVSADGPITITAGSGTSDDLVIDGAIAGSISSTSGSVDLDAGGEIRVEGIVIADQDITVTSAGDTVVDGTLGGSITSTSGPVDLDAGGEVRIEGSVFADLDVTITATDTANPGDDVTINGGLGGLVTSNSGNVNINAGDDVSISGPVIAGLAITIDVDQSGTTDATGSSVSIDPTTLNTTLGTDITGGNDADTFNIGDQLPEFVRVDGGADDDVLIGISVLPLSV